MNSLGDAIAMVVLIVFVTLVFFPEGAGRSVGTFISSAQKAMEASNDR